MSYLNRLKYFSIKGSKFQLKEEDVKNLEGLIDSGEFYQLTSKKYPNQADNEDYLVTELLGLCLAQDGEGRNTETQIRRVFNAIQAAQERVEQKEEMVNESEVSFEEIQKEIMELLQKAEKNQISIEQFLKMLQMKIIRWQASEEVLMELESSLLQIRSVVVYSSDKLKGIAKPLILHSIDSLLKDRNRMVSLFPDFVMFFEQMYPYFSDAVGKDTTRGG